ncbi:MAG: hypothetical protein ACO3LF_02720 [Candidatus Kariarchaeum pelagius]
MPPSPSCCPALASCLQPGSHQHSINTEVVAYIYDEHVPSINIPSEIDENQNQNKDKESLKTKLEEVRTLATQAENSHASSIIMNILQEVDQLLTSNNDHNINVNDINAKLDQASSMVTLSNNIKSALEDVNNMASTIMPGTAPQEKGITQQQIDQIIDISLKLYDIFANDRDLLKDIAEIFTNKNGINIDDQKKDLENIAKKLKTAKNTVQNDRLKEYYEETSDFFRTVAKDDNIAFITAAHSVVQSMITQQEMVDLKETQAELTKNLEQARAQQAAESEAQAKQIKELQEKVQQVQQLLLDRGSAPLSPSEPQSSPSEPQSSPVVLKPSSITSEGR